MKMCKPFIEDGVHPQVIIRAYRKATGMVGFFFGIRKLPLTREVYAITMRSKSAK